VKESSFKLAGTLHLTNGCLIKQFREAQNMMKMLQKTGGKVVGRLFG
jgi:hypothetical protein